ncbi:MAG: peptidoglycan DD-metalloendopeptidase family protein [Woeseia sp.]
MTGAATGSPGWWPIAGFAARGCQIALLVLALLLAGCGPATRWQHSSQESHVVRTGETLFKIAWRYGRDHRDLARWNGLGDGSLIYPGQVIKLNPPPRSASRGTSPGSSRAGPVAGSQRTAPASGPLPQLPSEPPPPWEWPASGSVAVEFGERPGTGTGILIGGTVGQPVRAAATGRVVYSGSGLIGYGQLIILRHNDTYLSAYGHNASLLVREGEDVRKGQPIATMGEGPGRVPRLHFEIRQNGQPVDPRQYLPRL